MPYSIEFQIAGLCIVLILTIIFFSKQRWKSLQNTIFRILMPFTIVELAFEFNSWRGDIRCNGWKCYIQRILHLCCWNGISQNATNGRN